MFDLKREWTISFAGCGFMGIYYVGATSCILERFPRFIQGASKIYGSSAGALMAAVLTIGIPLELTCADLMFMAKGARKHRLGPLHPAYNLLQLVKDSLQRMLPEDAHIRANGRLCVSLTRVSDGKNVLVSEYDSRDELMEALICSCFVPFYCGIIPPKYRGVHYVDGAVSDNLPRCHERNTVTISAFAGESDLCPRTSVLNFHQVRFNNMSVEVTGENMYRVKSTFFPPDAEEMAKISDNGYIDALRFLQDNDLISSECPLRGLALDTVCCELAKELAESEQSSETPQQSAVKQPREDHRWLDPKLVENLPVHIKKHLCEACRDAKNSGGFLSRVSDYLPKKMTSYLQMPRILPVGVESARSVAQRLVDWIPDVPGNMSWLYGMAGNMYKQAWKGDDEDYYSEEPVRRCSSLPSDLNLWEKSRGDLAVLPLTPPATPTSDLTFTWNKHSTKSGPSMPLTPPPTPTQSPTSGPGEATTESPKSTGGGWGLGRAVGWIRNSILPEQTPPN